MVTGFDYLSQDKVLQEHWLKRFAAVVIDFVIVSVPLWILFVLLGIPTVLTGMSSFLLLFRYSTFLEAGMGGTAGKRFLGMKVVPISGRLSMEQVVLRQGGVRTAGADCDPLSSTPARIRAAFSDAPALVASMAATAPLVAATPAAHIQPGVAPSSTSPRTRSASHLTPGV